MAIPLTFLCRWIRLKSEVAGGATHEPFGHIFTGGFARQEKRHKRHIPAAGLADQSRTKGEMGKVEAARLIISGPAHICPRCAGTATFFDRMWFLTRLCQPESARLSHPLTSGT